jgi:hypothetical protein
MIDPHVSAALERVAASERDVLHAYEPGFEPEDAGAASPTQRFPSASPLSVAAPDGAFFAVPGAGGTLRFTRDGTFSLVDGTLCERSGAPVLGFAPGETKRIAPLRVDPYDAALGRVAHPRIDADGTFAYDRAGVDPRTGHARLERVVVGRVALAHFSAGTQPQRLDATHLAAPAGSAPRVGVPADGAFAPLAIRVRDGGRLEIVDGLERMHAALESYEALRAANRARGVLEKSALDLVK